MKNNSVYSLLGLCAKGRMIAGGAFSAEKAIKAQRAFLVIVAGDASENTKKSFSDSCKFNNIPFFEYGSMEDLGKALGKESRAVAAVLNEGLADSIMKKMEALNESK